MRRGAGIASFAIVVAFGGAAQAAPTKRECIEANADAQTQQKSGHLKAAKADLLTCTNDACPGPVRDDCTRRLDALTTLMPVVVFEAKDANGGDLTAVTITMDGQALADHLDGSPFELDPGAHAFTFATAGAPAVQRTLLLSQGDLLRKERVVFAAPLAAPVSTTTPTPLPPPVEDVPAPPAKSERKTVGIVLGGIGLGGLVAGGILGGLASSKWSDAQDHCVSKTNCPDRNAAVASRSSALGLATGSTIALIAGGALVVGGVMLWVTAPSTSSAQVGMAGTF